MPYPIEKLKYGLRQRLRELTTPSEAYDFQIAAPHYIGFQPIQKMRQVDYVELTMDKEKNLQRMFSDRGSTLTDDDETLLNIASKIVIFNSFTPNDNLNVNFDTLQLSPENVYFYDCLLNTAFVQKTKKFTNAPIKIFYLCRSSVTSEEAVKIICNAFKTFYIKEPTFPSLSTWIEAFLEAECTSLKELYVCNALPSSFIIDKSIFLKFFKAQPDDFTIIFRMSAETEPDSILDLLKNLFDEHFEYTKVDRVIDKKSVSIRFRNDQYSHSYTLKDE